jgi:hypothetical protein
MLRFLSHVFGWNYEICKSCETLKQQLEYKTAENKELIDTLLSLVNPKVIHQPAPVEVKPAVGMTFSRQRAAREQADRQRSQIVKTSPFLAKPDELVQTANRTEPKTAEELERELGLEEEKQSNG